jgi:glycosidase
MLSSRKLALLAALAIVVPAEIAACTHSSGPSGTQANQSLDWRDQVIYQALTDRFADGDPNNNWNVDNSALAKYQGGDWLGMAQHADYLQQLGVTAVWISPAVKNVEEDVGVAGYHGYWTQDFGQTNPHFGDLNTLNYMVDTMHQHGIKVILDIVTNHIGQLFFYDINMNGQPDELLYGSGQPGSPLTRVTEYDPDWDPNGMIHAQVGSQILGPAPIVWINDPSINRVAIQPPDFQNPDWYHRRGRVVPDANGNWPPDQVLLGDFPGGLKDLATERQDVRDALARVFSDWVRKVDFDGFRIDTLKHVEHEFWQDFCPKIRAAALAKGKSNFFMFGEAYDGDDVLVGGYTQQNMVDSVFYFPQKYVAIDNTIKNNGPTSEIQNLFNRKANYGQAPQPGGVGVAPAHMFVNFIDNHDVARFLNGQTDTQRLQVALAYVFACEGVPCIYYGTEQGFAGGGDPANRERLWDSGYDTTSPLFQYIKNLAALRQQHVAFRHGDVAVRWATTRTGSETDAGIFAMERSDPAETALFVMNVNPGHASTATYNGADMQTSFAPGTVLKDLLDPTYTITVAQGGTAGVSVPALSARWLVAQ